MTTPTFDPPRRTLPPRPEKVRVVRIVPNGVAHYKPDEQWVHSIALHYTITYQQGTRPAVELPFVYDRKAGGTQRQIERLVRQDVLRREALAEEPVMALKVPFEVEMEGL